MRVGIIGAGAVGAASLLSLVMRGPPACEIIVLDKNYARAKGVVADLQYGATLSPAVELRTGDYPDLADAVLTTISSTLVARCTGPTVLGDGGWEKFPNLKRSADEISARPAAQRATALKERHQFKTEMDAEAGIGGSVAQCSELRLIIVGWKYANRDFPAFS
jgi:hypothetical protein